MTMCTWMSKDSRLEETSELLTSSSTSCHYYRFFISFSLCTAVGLAFTFLLVLLYEIALTIRSCHYLRSAYIYITFTVFLPICVCSRSMVLRIQAKKLPFRFSLEFSSQSHHNARLFSIKRMSTSESL